MKVLGVSATSGSLWLAIAQEDVGLTETDPPSVALPSGVESGMKLVEMRHDLTRILTRMGPDRIRLLAAESNAQVSYAGLIARMSVETLIALASAELSIDFARINRPRVRSLLGLPANGPLSSHAATVTEPVGPYWANKRDVAALTALAALKE